MTHFFFSLVREPDDGGKRMSLNLFFDTHIITQVTKPVLCSAHVYSTIVQVTLNVKNTFFDKISSIGGTLGLFCGVSMISILELFYYLLLFLKRVIFKKAETSEKLSLNINSNSRFD